MSYEATEPQVRSVRNIPFRWRSISVAAIVVVSATIWIIQTPNAEDASIQSAAHDVVAERWTALSDFHQERIDAMTRARNAETERLTRYAESIAGQALDPAQAAYGARLQATADALLSDG